MQYSAYLVCVCFLLFAYAIITSIIIFSELIVTTNHTEHQRKQQKSFIACIIYQL